MQDKNDNHISVHSRGSLANSASEAYSYFVQLSLPTLVESTHFVTISYTPIPPTFSNGFLLLEMVIFTKNH